MIEQKDNRYKKMFDKIVLSEEEKERAKRLYLQGKGEQRENSPVEERKGSQIPNIKLRGAGSHRRVGYLLRPIAAALVCLAVTFAAVLLPPVAEENQEKNTNSKTSPVSEHHFIVTAYAKELTKGGKVFANQYTSYNASLGGNKGDYYYSFEFPLACKGEQIDTITYRLEEGSFVIQGIPDTGGIIVDSERLHGDNYRSFTVKYDKQTDGKTRIMLFGETKEWSRKKKKEFEALGYDILKSSLKKDKEAWDLMLRDIGLTCTVTYQDGSTETKHIVVSNEILKCPEDEKQKDLFRCYSLG